MTLISIEPQPFGLEKVCSYKNNLDEIRYQCLLPPPRYGTSYVSTSDIRDMPLEPVKASELVFASVAMWPCLSHHLSQLGSPC